MRKHWGKNDDNHEAKPDTVFIEVRDEFLLYSESTTTRKAGGLEFTAFGGKRQGREVPQIVENNAVETVDSRAKHPVWKTQSFLLVNSFFSSHNDVGGRIYFAGMGFSGDS